MWIATRREAKCQEVVVDEWSHQSSATQEHGHDRVGHEENLREGNQSQDVALLELDQRNQEASAPPTVLAQHLREKRKPKSFSRLNVPQPATDRSKILISPRLISTRSARRHAKLTSRIFSEWLAEWSTAKSTTGNKTRTKGCT